MISAFAVLALATVQAPAPDTAGLGWLTGSWRGIGTMFLQNSAATLEVRPALGGRFVELRWQAGGFEGRDFEGRAFYRPAGDGRWRAAWFDSRGTTFPIEAVLSGRTLTALWGSAETERGRTVYTLGTDGRLDVTDSVRQPDGSYRIFATHGLTRAE